MKPSKRPTARTSWEQFTSDEIDEILEQSANFRAMNPHRSNQMLDQMRSGSWKWDNGQTFLFDEDGELIDGQHRMRAISMWQRESGEAPFLLCVRGVSKELADESIDTGYKRTISDYLKKHGVKNASFVKPVLTVQCTAAEMKRSDSLAFLGFTGRMTRRVDGVESTFIPTLAMMVDQFKRHRKDVEYWAEVGSKLLQERIASAGLLAAIGFQLAKYNDTNAKLFFSYLTDGSAMKDGDPALVLRETLRKSVGKSLSRSYISAITVKAWRLWNEGASIRLLRWTSSGPYAEEFPDHRCESA